MSDDWQRAPEGVRADDDDGEPGGIRWRPAGSRELRADSDEIRAGWWLWDSSVSPARWYQIVEVEHMQGVAGAERLNRVTLHLDSSEVLRVSFRPDIMVTVAPPR